jgi:hypothetical protein
VSGGLFVVFRALPEGDFSGYLEHHENLFRALSGNPRFTAIRITFTQV